MGVSESLSDNDIAFSKLVISFSSCPDYSIFTDFAAISDLGSTLQLVITVFLSVLIFGNDFDYVILIFLLFDSRTI